MIPVYIVVAQLRDGESNQAVFSSEGAAKEFIAKWVSTPLSQYVNFYTEEFYLDSSPSSPEAE